MRIAGVFVAASLLSFSLVASADTSKAWTAAKAGLPSDAKIVIGLDVAAMQKTQLFTTFYPKLLAQNGNAETFDKLKTACKVDPLVAVQGFVVATTADQSEGAAYIGLAGIDPAKMATCLQAASKDDKVKLTVKQNGTITEINDGKTTSYIGWVGKDVIVVPLKVEDKASLEKWMGGKGALAKSDVGKTLAKVNTSAALWGAGIATKTVGSATIKGGYGAVKVNNGNLDADVHAVMSSPDEAKTMAAQAKTQIDQMKAGSGLPPAIANLAKGVTVSNAAEEVVVKASLVEKDLLSVLALALPSLGSSSP